MGGSSSRQVEDSLTPEEAAMIEGMLHKCIVDLHDLNSPTVQEGIERVKREIERQWEGLGPRKHPWP